MVSVMFLYLYYPIIEKLKQIKEAMIISKKEQDSNLSPKSLNCHIPVKAKTGSSYTMNNTNTFTPSIKPINPSNNPSIMAVDILGKNQN